MPSSSANKPSYAAVVTGSSTAEHRPAGVSLSTPVAVASGGEGSPSPTPVAPKRSKKTSSTKSKSVQAKKESSRSSSGTSRSTRSKPAAVDESLEPPTKPVSKRSRTAKSDKKPVDLKADGPQSVTVDRFVWFCQ